MTLKNETVEALGPNYQLPSQPGTSGTDAVSRNTVRINDGSWEIKQEQLQKKKKKTRDGIQNQ